MFWIHGTAKRVQELRAVLRKLNLAAEKDPYLGLELTLYADASFQKEGKKLTELMEALCSKITKMNLIFYGFGFNFQQMTGRKISSIWISYDTVMPETAENEAFPKLNFSRLKNLKKLVIDGTLTVYGLNLFFKNMREQGEISLEELHIKAPKLFRFYGPPARVEALGRCLKPSTQTSLPPTFRHKDYKECAVDSEELVNFIGVLSKSCPSLHLVTIKNNWFQKRYGQQNLITPVEIRHAIEHRQQDRIPSPVMFVSPTDRTKENLLLASECKDSRRPETLQRSASYPSRCPTRTRILSPS